jgi:hypothetical protein
MHKIRTVSGRDLDVGTMTPADIQVEDISLPLSRQCRFGGRLSRHYSVAEHAVHVARVILMETRSATLAYKGLHHDDDEAFTVDVPQPVKYMPGMEAFRAEGKRVLEIVHAAFNIDPAYDPLIKAVDTRVCEWEQVLLLNTPEDVTVIIREIQGALVREGDKPFVSVLNQLRFPCWPAEEAEFQFLAWHKVLKAHAQPFSVTPAAEAISQEFRPNVLKFPVTVR